MTPDKKDMTPKSCRAARGLLGLGRDALGKSAGVSMLTIRNYEEEKTEPAHKTWRAIRSALEKAGIQFIDEDDTGGPGVRLRKGRK